MRRSPGMRFADGAQAVPDAGSAIGVATYPPPLHCDVTTYDGPGSPPPFNGNVWTGNTYQHIDPCLPAQETLKRK